ncbi:MAG: HIT family protein [Candidatus Bathyarchaeota archaeon]|nr:HIT family protein [Candidatus Bathyarchaeota archaeon]
MYADSCIFCKITSRQASASVVYEDETALAFLDIKPLSEGHTLVIPKKHYATIFEIPDDLVSHVHKIAKRVALAVKEAVKADGVSIVQQNGRAADQEILHLHVHVIPRFVGKKLTRFTETSEASRERLDQTAAKIKQHLKIS